MEKMATKVKRLLAFVLSLVMVLSLAACQKSPAQDETKAPEVQQTEATKAPSETKAPVDEEPELEHMEITVGFWDVDEIVLAGDAMLDTISEKFNVTLVPQTFTWADVDQKTQLWASTNSLPDIWAGAWRDSSNFKDYVEDGVIRAIPSDLSKYPNLDRYFTNEPAAAECMYDGEYYCIFRKTYGSVEETVKDSVVIYRWDLAQKAGITQEPKNWEEFQAMLSAIIAADPEGKDIGGLTTQSSSTLGYTLFAYSVPSASVSAWVKEGDRYVPGYFAGETLGADVFETFKMARKMWDDGLIDPDIALASVEQCRNKFLNGQAAAAVVTGGTIGGSDDSISLDWEKLYGTPAEDSIKILDLMPNFEGNASYSQLGYAYSESYFSANVDDEKMERILMIYDYLLSNEGILLSNYGFEGEDYVIKDGMVELLITTEDLMEKYPSYALLNDLAEWDPHNLDGIRFPVKQVAWYAERAAELVEQAEKVTFPEMSAAHHKYQLSMDATEKVKYSKSGDLIKMMTGTEPIEDMWKAAMDAYLEAGLDEFINKVNEAVK